MKNSSQFQFNFKGRQIRVSKVLLIICLIFGGLLAAGQFFESLGASKAAQDCKDCKEKTEIPASENN